jgi:hypothetical protein
MGCHETKMGMPCGAVRRRMEAIGRAVRPDFPDQDWFRKINPETI